MHISAGPVIRTMIDVEDGYHLSGALGLSGAIGHEEDDFGLQRPSRNALALSPDGRHLVYAAIPATERRSQLFLRPLDSNRAIPMTGTEGACCPFFSPDGDWVGFAADGALRRTRVDGADRGTVVVLPAEGLLWGASWGDDGSIVFSHGRADRAGLFRVPARGGAPEPLMEGDGGRVYSPALLPGGKAVLFTAKEDLFFNPRIDVLSPATGERETLITNGSDARYVPTGHLVFARQGAPLAVPFDSQRLRLQGEPFHVYDDVMQARGGGNSDLDTGSIQLSFSQNGLLAYATGGEYPELETALMWVDRDGGDERLPLPLRDYLYPRLSPDETLLAYAVGRPDEKQLWVYDIRREIPRPLTFEGRVCCPVWSPDSKRLAFTGYGAGGGSAVYLVAADGTGPRERLVADAGVAPSSLDDQVSSWSVEGVLAFVRNDDIWVVSVDGDRTPTPFVETPRRAALASRSFPTGSRS